MNMYVMLCAIKAAFSASCAVAQHCFARHFHLASTKMGVLYLKLSVLQAILKTVGASGSKMK